MYVFKSTDYVKFMTRNGKIRSSNMIFHSSKRTVWQNGASPPLGGSIIKNLGLSFQE